MKLTVMIPTYNGKMKVRQLLSRLEQQSDPSFSVHVLIDGSPDDTYVLKEQFPKCQFHVYENSGRAGIRNKALEHCKEGVILFLDHDMLPESDLVATHRAFHEQNADSILVGNGFRNPQAAKNEFAQYLIESETKWKDNHDPEFKVTKGDFVFSACNMSLPVHLFSRLNGFNTMLKDGEDFEFGMRAMNAGINIQYNRNAIAWHDDWPTISEYIQRNSEYLAGKKILVKLNPDFEQYLKVNAGEKSHNKIKQFLQTILGRAAVNNNLLFRVLPRRFRFIAFRSAIYQFSKA